MYFEWTKTFTEKDRADVLTLMNAVALNETTMGYHEALTQEQEDSLINAMIGEMDSHNCHILFIRNEERKIVAMVTIVQQTLPARKHIVEVKRCTILPEYRNGLIFDGWKVTLEKIKEIGGDIAILDVRSDGNAEKLWRLMGFKEYGRLDDYARAKGKNIVGYFMYLYVEDALKYYETHGTWLKK
ncbi:hypothetical protein KDD30_10480 [Photobacterium sp. GJ3]|uniref:hypothetical protein n=1 Tax=Photobacterium sp. GJ3 TaxID=2829502 RepID=UPI001B8C5AEE|nr:hypothetical protein [Photobacterium sp. GJ3]QUJ66587.1 hypothetical protein KDD30_10480 [Photobacterium sp. GJ3]